MFTSAIAYAHCGFPLCTLPAYPRKHGMQWAMGHGVAVRNHYPGLSYGQASAAKQSLISSHSAEWLPTDDHAFVDYYVI